MEKKWTPQQQQVIDLRNRNLLVSAAAGSGSGGGGSAAGGTEGGSAEAEGAKIDASKNEEDEG